MLGRSASHAIRALLELAEQPLRWRSVRELAEAQQLPEPLLEQLMLRLRRAGLLEARRGRLGGYRLARPAAAIPLAAILEAVVSRSASPSGDRSPGASSSGASIPGRIGEALELATLEFCPPVLPDPGSRSPGQRLAPLESGEERAEPDAATRVTGALERRLRQALERELARCTLEELLHDLRSARAALSDDGGLLLG
jgi:Rrf2 family protein